MVAALPPVPSGVRIALALLFLAELGLALSVAFVMFLFAGGFMDPNPDAVRDRLLVAVVAVLVAAVLGSSVRSALTNRVRRPALVLLGALAQWALAVPLALQGDGALAYAAVLVLGGAGSCWLALALARPEDR